MTSGMRWYLNVSISICNIYVDCVCVAALDLLHLAFESSSQMSYERSYPAECKHLNVQPTLRIFWSIFYFFRVYFWLKYNGQLKSVNNYYYMEESTKLWSRKGEIHQKSSYRSKNRMYEACSAQIYLLQQLRFNKSSILICCSLLLLGKVVWFDSFILPFGDGTSNHLFELL